MIENTSYISIIIAVLNFVHYVSANVSAYCDFGVCNEDIEECCGQNQCCKKGLDIWYYWAISILIVGTIMVTACLYMRRFKFRHQASAYSYQRLQTEPNSILQT